MIGFIAGLEPSRLSNYVLRFSRGAAVAALDESLMMKFPSSKNDVDLNTVGLWGMDRGRPVAGLHIFPYLLHNDETSESGIIISSSKIMDGVHCPPGFSVKRKQSFGLVLGADGLPAFHASGFPKPIISYTEFRPPVLLSGSGSFSVARDVPDNARLVWLHCQVIAPSRAGSAYIRAPGTADWQPVGNANPASGVKSIGPFRVRCNSNGMVDHKTDGGASFRASVTDYAMTEPMV